jgi:hypothetical protein
MAGLPDPGAEDQGQESGGTAWLAFVFTGFLVGLMSVYTLSERSATVAGAALQTVAYQTDVADTP